MTFEQTFNGIGRQELERLAAGYLANLTAVQTRCTELLEENRKLREGIVLPGWWCTACQGFNGAAKELRTECRCCGVRRAT